MCVCVYEREKVVCMYERGRESVCMGFITTM